MKLTRSIFILSLCILILSGCATTAPVDQEENTAVPGNAAVATFAGGCFWCTESDYEKIPGVYEAISGYAGGEEVNPSYKQVSSGKTGHREAVQVYYDPLQVSYAQLVEVLWRETDVTDAEGSFFDRGFQYSSAIYYNNEEEKKIAEDSKQALEADGPFDKPIATEILAFTSFYRGEDYHQDYAKKNPLRYNYYRSGSGRDVFIENAWGDKEAFKNVSSKE